MITLLKQEQYKFFKTPLNIISYFLVFISVVVIGYLLNAFGESGYNIAYSFFNSFGYVGWLITILVIVSAVNIFSVEFTSGSVKLLFGRQYGRINIFFSKFFSIILFHLELIFIAWVGRVLSTFFYSKDAMNAIKEIGVQQGMRVNNDISLLFAELLSSWIIISFVILLIVLMIKPVIPTVIGVLLIASGQTIGSLLMQLAKRISFVVYNPFNFGNAGMQLLQPDIYTPITKLNLGTIITLNISTVILFLLIALIAFNKKRA